MRATNRAGRSCTAALRAVGLTILMLLAGPISPAAAATSDGQLKQERVDVLARKAKAAARVDALKADSALVSRALGALQTNVASQRLSLQSADNAARNARAAVEAAKDAEARGRGALAAARAGVKQAAIASYVSGNAKAPAVTGTDVDTLARAKAYGALATGRRTDAVDQVNAARKDLERLSKTRQAASTSANNKLTAAQQRLISLNSSLAEQQGFAEAVSSRLDATLAEAQSLAGLDQALSDEITKRETALAARLAAAAAPRSRPAAPAGGGPGGPVGSVTISGSGDIVTVRGIQVHRSIADNLARMLTASDGAGLRMSGGGYRSSEQQVALRRAHCSGDPYTAPASSCSPPTARPGQSMHERGLAIDFTCSGNLIRSRSDPCFTWLKGNAGGFGFYNLPSEAWHWSVNGN